MRTLEPWVASPLEAFLRESEARLVLLMTSSGQVIAQHGFTRSLDVMAAAALGAGIVATTDELARVMDRGRFGHVAHQASSQGVLLGSFAMPSGTWVCLVVFGRETTLGLVQVFFGRLAEELRRAQPVESLPAPLLAERFEEELNASLRTLFGR